MDELPEKRVAQHNVVYVPTRRIIEHILVYEKEKRHVDFFACEELLLFEAEALDFGKIRRDLTRPEYLSVRIWIREERFHTPDRESRCMSRFR